MTLKSLRISFAAGALAVCGASLPALARDWPTTAGWEVFEGDDYCGMALEYDGKGDTVLSVAKRLDGDALVIVTNYAWSAKKGEAYDLKFYVGDQVFSGGKSMGTGESYERKGFVTLFGADFFPAFASGTSFKVYKGDTLVDSLSLVGSASASAMVGKCVAYVRGIRAAEERERKKFAHIPDDPFASDKPSASAPIARGASDAWVSADDYPPSSLRAREEGTTQIKFGVNAQGRVENCVVTTSSGSSALDRATCSSVTRRGRYNPSIGADGNPAATERTMSYTWRLPPD
ncbi:energy transducer TonB [Sphingomonas sp. Leaf230]|uniref:energy transducer TonB n=1 Tax=Sphingomonas sp. Leaf230 TaxID=1735694 RepID=UPI000A6B1FD8|nr:energy transducer TonB [Sphingomonas sp. Leaf230]